MRSPILGHYSDHLYSRRDRDGDILRNLVYFVLLISNVTGANNFRPGELKADIKYQCLTYHQ